MASARADEARDGRHEPSQQLTARALAAGLGVGLLLCCTNTYLGLQSGWISMMSLQASLLGFGLFKALPATFVRRPLTTAENVLLQTTAVATGTLPLAAGLVSVVPALAMLDQERDGAAPVVLSLRALIGWCLSVAFFGVFLVVPLRKQFIVREKLVFPSGTATAHIISVLHHDSPESQSAVRHRRKRSAQYQAVATDDNAEGTGADQSHAEDDEEVTESKVDRSSWLALSWSFAMSAGYTLLTLAFPVLYALPVFDFLGPVAHDWLWWFSPSFSYIGQGIIMGPSTVFSMNAGMLVGWAFLVPLAKHTGWAPGPVSSNADGAKAWIVWPALAIMTAESVLSLASVALFTLARSRRAKRDERSDDDDDDDTAEEVSLKLVVAGLGAASIFCVAATAAIFGSEGIKWWATAIALVLACAFSILGVRALGETDINPVSAIGKLSQLLFAFIQPGNVVANLIAGGISEAGAQQAADLAQDLKTGYLLDASPKAQFYGQLIGSFASVFCSSAIYALYRRVYELPSTSFQVPQAAVWLNLARLVNSGRLPDGAPGAMIVFGAIFLLFSSIRTFASFYPALKGSFWFKFVPSGIAFAVGFITTPSFSLARLIGAIISLYGTRHQSHTSSSTPAHLQNLKLIIIASGFVLGEGSISIVGLFLRSAHIGAVSCAGCHSGGGGYCGNGC